MGETTKIEWCDATLNLWWGCTKVSGGCKNCYAEKLSDKRYKKGAWGPGLARAGCPKPIARASITVIRPNFEQEDKSIVVSVS